MHKALIFLAASLWPSQNLAQSGDTPLSYEDYVGIASQISIADHRLDTATFLEMRAAGAVVIDLRGALRYGEGHLPGALHLDAGNITANALAELIASPDQTILLYCENSMLPTRMISLTDLALPQFIAHGYGNVFIADFMALAPALADGRLVLVPGEN